MDSQKNYRKAKQRAGAKMGFYIHAVVFGVVILFLAVLNMVMSPTYMWFLWVFGGWGLGLVFHGMGVFLFTSGSTDKLVAQEMEKLES